VGKAARAQELAAAFLRILALHRVDFPPAQRPVAVLADIEKSLLTDS
jgi:hypothetical protein